ncbi:MAG: AAA family ATPase, partial [Clostridiales bacterium]|nr:AAA family ATPase [Clostridiales bacterium]
ALATPSGAGAVAGVGEDKAVSPQPTDHGVTATGDFDACPAFTEIDNLQDKFQAALEKRRAQLFKNLTLPNLIRFVVDYARESRLHLSYTPDDIATFVAGLGASRLTILQGMSGTGKTSLPKIFTEALMSNCEIVEVESSWRDKNELLGYYNEFSKCYTPKKFTQCLYRARLNSEVITFIVLDEMNLSRIEYYFSDFLSLMENEEDRRAIKLLNVKLSRIENGKAIEYDGLKDGHTIKVPTNVWFIGTANRDESTFEISDKVYDRAQTMNFDKRAPKIESFSEPIEKRYISYEMLAKLFEEAKQKYKFDAEDNRYIRETEKLLAPYNISFGNRILRQIEAFVKVYCACFGDKSAAGAENDAVERILLSKVVRKLENKVVENKEKLAVEFDKIGLNKCSAFIRKLNED